MNLMRQSTAVLVAIFVTIIAATVLIGCTKASQPKRHHVPTGLHSGTEGVFRPPPGSESWLQKSVILTMYGRGFGIAPVLGRLGYDANFADMERQVQPLEAGIERNDGGASVIVGVHLIYGLAMPCADQAQCVLDLDDSGVNIVKQYILPAKQKHWLVILDTQLGTTSPLGAVDHLIQKGYLKYDNVEVAIDPEFHLSGPSTPQSVPGTTFGSVTARAINRAQSALNAYVAKERLPHKKLLIVHEFQSAMIQNQSQIRNNFHNVQVVINADGLGSPVVKAESYRTLVGPRVKSGVRYRGIKLFLPNPAVDDQHTDEPVMQWRQVFGHWPMIAEGVKYWINPAPNLVIIA